MASVLCSSRSALRPDVKTTRVCTPFRTGACQLSQRSLARQVAASAAASDELVPDEAFSISKVSFGSILLPVGVVLMTFGFGAYFGLIGGGDISGVALVYGFPTLLLGFALQYAQLEPVPCKTTRAAFDLRATQMTDIQKQVREDCTRFRYGDEQHLEEALSRVLMIGRPTGVPRRQCPRLTGLREEVVDGGYALIMEFENRNGMTQEAWMERQDKFTGFFGPGLTATVKYMDDKNVEIVLRSDGSGLGMGGEEKQDVLPPLTPSSKPRMQ